MHSDIERTWLARGRFLRQTLRTGQYRRLAVSLLEHCLFLWGLLIERRGPWLALFVLMLGQQLLARSVLRLSGLGSVVFTVLVLGIASGIAQNARSPAQVSAVLLALSFPFWALALVLL